MPVRRSHTRRITVRRKGYSVTKSVRVRSSRVRRRR